jgi:hypothetical protein
VRNAKEDPDLDLEEEEPREMTQNADVDDAA